MVQSSPPCILVGLSQFLVLVWLAPLHVTGHDSHAFHSPHPPLTFERSKQLAIIYFHCENCDCTINYWTISGKLLKCYEIPNIWFLNNKFQRIFTWAGTFITSSIITTRWSINSTIIPPIVRGWIITISRSNLIGPSTCYWTWLPGSPFSPTSINLEHTSRYLDIFWYQSYDPGWKQTI